MTLSELKSQFAMVIANKVGFVPQDVACGWLLSHRQALAALWQRKDTSDTAARKILTENVANLFLNTLCISCQYNVNLELKYTLAGISLDLTSAINDSQPITLDTKTSDELTTNLKCINELFDVMAFYHGWNRERPAAESAKGLGDPILKVHRLVHGLCKDNQIDLGQEMKKIVQVATGRIRENLFRYDPSNSSILDTFKRTKDTSVCEHAMTSFFWGAEPYPGTNADSESPDFDSYLNKCLPVLARLSRCAKNEDVNCFLMVLPAGFGDTVEKLAKTISKILRHLWFYDPSGSHEDESPAAEKNWRFKFCDCEYFVQAFGPAYSSNWRHTRLPKDLGSSLFPVGQ